MRALVQNDGLFILAWVIGAGLSRKLRSSGVTSENVIFTPYYHSENQLALPLLT